ncbi:cell division control protein 14, SIN component-domain-containing protein [Schizophyllum fasciatum]
MDDARPLAAAIQDELDALCSSRSSTATRGNALDALERILAGSCLTEDGGGSSHTLMALQYTFECNIPSRLLAYLAAFIPKVEELSSKGLSKTDRELDEPRLVTQMRQALCLIQGFALNHASTKEWLGRKYALEIFVDLFVVSRHLYLSPDDASRKASGGSQNAPTTPSASGESGAQSPSLPYLSSVVLDTLLCILVDSPAALRMFEECSGVQSVVRILKRAGTPREVRMKCLEFLYFYLLDESAALPTPKAELINLPSMLSPPPIERRPSSESVLSDGSHRSSEETVSARPSRPPTPSTPPSVPSVPATPVRRPRKPYLNGTPQLPGIRQGSAPSLVFSNASRSTSNSSASSFSTASTNSTGSASSGRSAGSTAPSSPEKGAFEAPMNKPTFTLPVTATPRRTATPRPLDTSALPAYGASDTHALLRGGVDYVPVSPRKADRIDRSALGRDMPATERKRGSVVGLGMPRRHVRGAASVSSVREITGRDASATSSRLGVSTTSRDSSMLSRDASGMSQETSMSASRLWGVPTRSNSGPATPAARPESSATARAVSSVPATPVPTVASLGAPAAQSTVKVRTTDEKREILSTMLGNVDALVDGVRKAGIWGLS